MAEIALVPNRGYDIAPLLLEFRDKASNHDICLKIHGKSGLHRVRRAMAKPSVQELIGDGGRAGEIVSAMVAKPALGVLIAQHYYGVEASSVSARITGQRRRFERIGYDLLPDQKIEYPSGSMFWFRSEALDRLWRLLIGRISTQIQRGWNSRPCDRALLPILLRRAGKRWGFLPPLYRTGPKISRDEVLRMIRASGQFDEIILSSCLSGRSGCGRKPGRTLGGLRRSRGSQSVRSATSESRDFAAN